MIRDISQESASKAEANHDDRHALNRISAADAPVTHAGRPTENGAAEILDVLCRFSEELDLYCRPFLEKQTGAHQTLRTVWHSYCNHGGVAELLDHVGSKPNRAKLGVLRVKLNMLCQWIEAFMLATDISSESIASELRTYLNGGSGSPGHRTATVREFLKEDGPELFMQHMRQVRRNTLDEVFGKTSKIA